MSAVSLSMWTKTCGAATGIGEQGDLDWRLMHAFRVPLQKEMVSIELHKRNVSAAAAEIEVQMYSTKDTFITTLLPIRPLSH